MSLSALVVMLIIFGATLLCSPPAGLSPSAYAEGKTTPKDLSVAAQPAVGKEDQTAMVEVPAGKRPMMGIRTVGAAVKPLKKTLRTVGRVEINERKLTTVNIKVEGWIEKLYADYTGKYVKKGTPLAEIYSPELMSVQLEYINLLNMQSSVGFRSQRNVEFSWGDRYGTVGRVNTYDLEGLVHVAKQKFELWEIPDEQIKDLEKTKKPMKILTIKSPRDGYVFQKPVLEGTRVAPGDKLFDTNMNCPS
jgi:Cu(I)/Ag(I) efflux system membrane fusion protein